MCDRQFGECLMCRFWLYNVGPSRCAVGLSGQTHPCVLNPPHPKYGYPLTKKDDGCGQFSYHTGR